MRNNQYVHQGNHQRYETASGTEITGGSSTSKPVKEASVPTPTEEAPTSTIPSDSLYSLATKAAIRFMSKGFGVVAAKGFVARGWTVGFVCAGGFEIGLLSERRTTISWQSTSI